MRIGKGIILTMLVGLMILNKNSSAQKLEIGDHCPPVELDHVLNWNTPTIRFSDFKGKLIILDFWSPGCSSCIEGFPELEALQKKFKNNLQIILVNQQSMDSTLHFFSKRKRMIKMPNLPMVTSDSILDQFFPHNSFPHDIWIDSARIVRYIVTGYNTNEKNIRAFLEGKPPVLKEKKDIFNFNDNVPVIAEGNGRWVNRALYYSYIMHTIPAQVADILDSNHIIKNSASIAELFKIAFNEVVKYNFNPSNRVILEVKDKARYIYPENAQDIDKWAKNNAYYYELKIPASDADKLYQFMQQDLERYFNVNAYVTQRKIMCLVLVRTGNLSKFKSKGGKMDSNIYSAAGDTACYFHNYTLGGIMQKLQPIYQYKLSTPFIDGTGYKQKVDIELSRNAIGKLPLLRKGLSKYNLKLVKEPWLTTVLVVHQK